jgi:hypothetical protein
MKTAVIWLSILGLLAVTPAFAQGDDEGGSVALTLEQLANEIENYITPKSGIVVHHVLPKNWELIEQGKDETTGRLKDGLPVYVLVSRAPVAQKNDPTDLIFELSIYEQGLLDNLPANTPADEKKVGIQFRKFINAQMSFFLKSGFKVRGQVDFKAKPYGGFQIDPKTGKKFATRPPQYFVPIAYDVPQDPKNPNSRTAILYTFNTFTADKVWTLKFLVNKDRAEDYEGLIAIVLNNSFALSEADHKKLLAKTNEERAKAGKGN